MSSSVVDVAEPMKTEYEFEKYRIWFMFLLDKAPHLRNSLDLYIQTLKTSLQPEKPKGNMGSEESKKAVIGMVVISKEGEEETSQETSRQSSQGTSLRTSQHSNEKTSTSQGTMQQSNEGTFQGISQQFNEGTSQGTSQQSNEGTSQGTSQQLNEGTSSQQSSQVPYRGVLLMDGTVMDCKSFDEQKWLALEREYFSNLSEGKVEENKKVREFVIRSVRESGMSQEDLKRVTYRQRLMMDVMKYKSNICETIAWLVKLRREMETCLKTINKVVAYRCDQFYDPDCKTWDSGNPLVLEITTSESAYGELNGLAVSALNRALWETRDLPLVIWHPNSNAISEEDSEGVTCLICQEKYTNSGDHKLSCLKCGHLFGQRCILKWLKKCCQTGARRCPVCNTDASVKDIVVLYTKNLVAVDTIPMDALKEELQAERNEKRKMSEELHSTKSKMRMLKNKLKELEEKGRNAAECSANSVDVDSDGGVFRSEIVTVIQLGTFGGGRVLAYNPYSRLLVCSQASDVTTFGSHGIRKICVLDNTPVNYFPLHRKAVRDMKFSNFCPTMEDTLMTVSLDCTAKLFNTKINKTVQEYKVKEPLWCCCWGSENPNRVLLGGQNGTIYGFDVRYNGSNEFEHTDPNIKGQVIDLCQVNPKMGRFMHAGGYLVARKDRVQSMQIGAENMVHTKTLPLAGNVTCVRYDNDTDHILTSCRPSATFGNGETSAPAKKAMMCTTHTVARMLNPKFGEEDVVQVVKEFYGSRPISQLTRSNFVDMANNEKGVCAYNANVSSIDLWNMGTFCSYPVNSRKVSFSEPILDLCSYNLDNKTFIPCLSEKNLAVVKCTF